jgi:hypothetical protein
MGRCSRKRAAPGQFRQRAADEFATVGAEVLDVAVAEEAHHEIAVHVAEQSRETVRQRLHAQLRGMQAVLQLPALADVDAHALHHDRIAGLAGVQPAAGADPADRAVAAQDAVLGGEAAVAGHRLADRGPVTGLVLRVDALADELRPEAGVGIDVEHGAAGVVEAEAGGRLLHSARGRRRYPGAAPAGQGPSSQCRR